MNYRNNSQTVDEAINFATINLIAAKRCTTAPSEDLGLYSTAKRSTRMFYRHTLGHVAALGASMPSTLLSAQKTERLVKDQVQTRPVRDPYADLLKASQLLSAGQSLFARTQPKQTEPA
jgi:hypothetical protein